MVENPESVLAVYEFQGTPLSDIYVQGLSLSPVILKQLLEDLQFNLEVTKGRR